MSKLEKSGLLFFITSIGLAIVADNAVSYVMAFVWAALGTVAFIFGGDK